jgi:hypothetical protein
MVLQTAGLVALYCAADAEDCIFNCCADHSPMLSMSAEQYHACLCKSAHFNAIHVKSGVILCRMPVQIGPV